MLARTRSHLAVLTATLSLVVVGLATVAGPSAQAADGFTVGGSARQVYAVGLSGGATVSLLDGEGAVVETREATAEGGVLFRHVPPGSGYQVRDEGSDVTEGPVTVHTNSPKQWNKSIYDQTIPSDGYGYLTTRDGTQLAYSVHPPYDLGGINPGDLPLGAPFPTLVEYSGYGYANPAGPDSGIAAIANALGFGVVDIQMRGTGCSGGAFDFFEPLQSIDGYDIIETISRQSWVQGHKVGMLGISYGGISQLFTAKTQPPHLAAITPLSTISATATTLYPGGVLNTGFAVAWAKERQEQAQPAGTGAEGTQQYAEDRIAGGDTTCEANQALHGEAADLMTKIRANDHYRPRIADPLDPVSFVHKIEVPTFLACQWEDEQTGGHCPVLVSHFTGTRKKWFTFTNGAHIDSLDPATLNRLFDFLMIYVAKQAPATHAPLLKLGAPVVYQQAMGLPAGDPITMPSDPVQQQATYADAKALFEQLKPVRVLFDNGAGAAPDGSRDAGDPYPAYERSFTSLPVPGVRARSFYLGKGGSLRGHVAKRRNVDRYSSDPSSLPGTDFTGGTGPGGLWGNASQWSWDWKQREHGTAVSYVSPKLTKGLTAVGGGAVQLWVRSSASDVDFQATVSEVRNGHETFVQSGWLRGSGRKLATTRHNILKQEPTLLQPIPTMREEDVRPLPHDRFVKVVIPLYYQGHAYRKGSRIRVTISAPGGDQPIWQFAEAVPDDGPAHLRVLSSRKHPSRLVLPVLPHVGIGSPAPPCPSLRNQPCRDYQPFHNE